jgi:hypothetical protein
MHGGIGTARRFRALEQCAGQQALQWSAQCREQAGRFWTAVWGMGLAVVACLPPPACRNYFPLKNTSGLSAPVLVPLVVGVVVLKLLVRRERDAHTAVLRALLWHPRTNQPGYMNRLPRRVDRPDGHTVTPSLIANWGCLQ